jgi:hypothetical protein
MLGVTVIGDFDESGDIVGGIDGDIEGGIDGGIEGYIDGDIEGGIDGDIDGGIEGEEWTLAPSATNRSAISP